MGAQQNQQSQREWPSTDRITNVGQEGKGCFVTSFNMLEHGDCSICLVETFPCNSKDELTAREQFHIDDHADICVNKYKAFTGLTKEEYDAQYHEANRAEIKQYKTQYYETNREEIRQKANQYREANRAVINQKANQYYEANREEIKQRANQYREATREEIRQKANQYREANRDKMNQQHQCQCGGQCTQITKLNTRILKNTKRISQKSKSSPRS